MADVKRYLYIHIEDDKVVTIKKFSATKEMQAYTIEPPEQLSEGLWSLLPKLFSNKELSKLSGIVFQQEEGKGTYSTVRTVLSIINTLGIVENIPVYQAIAGECHEDWLQEFNNKKTNLKEVQAIYS